MRQGALAPISQPTPPLNYNSQQRLNSKLNSQMPLAQEGGVAPGTGRDVTPGTGRDVALAQEGGVAPGTGRGVAPGTGRDVTLAQEGGSGGCVCISQDRECGAHRVPGQAECAQRPAVALDF